MIKFCFIFCCLVFAFPSFIIGQNQTLRVGAKHFNEGYILSEMIALLLEDGGFKVERKFNLGGTAVSFEALRNKAIDIYPEYTGTISTEILKQDSTLSWNEIKIIVGQKFQLEISEPYGFNNTYALVISDSLSQKSGIHTISDLQLHPNLKPGLSYEFLKRKDGWDNLAEFYKLPQQPVGLEHGLAYQAILQNKIQVTDAYSTDGEINEYKLLLLQDDKKFFPEYHAVSFYVSSLPLKAKYLVSKLTNSISREEMQSLNRSALFDKKSYQEIAKDFLLEKKLIHDNKQAADSDIKAIFKKTWVHLKLTLLALFAAIFVAIPAGIFLYRYPFFSKAILYITGILQTIPSIALLALMIPFLGIGMLPAVIALFIYALLPVLRNTVIGLFTVDPQLKKVASAIGLTYWQQLKLIELPLAMPTIITGIRTAAVINVGTATLAAFIGAGGLGEFIVTGLALNNTNLILMGAIPSAILAILMELLFEGVEWFTIPKHLRQKIY